MFKKLFIAWLVVFYTALFANAQTATITEEIKPPFDVEGITKEVLLQPMPEDVIVGDENAPITIIEYSSMSCPHCAHFYNDTYKELKEKYIDTGKVKFIFRDFPLNEPALRGSMLARCAGEDKFEKFTDVMFSTQSNWISKKNFLEILSNIGKLGGLKGEEFDACMADKTLEEAVMKSKYLGVTVLSVRSTPTFFVNGEEHRGAKSFEYFSKLIDNLLEKKE